MLNQRSTCLFCNKFWNTYESVKAREWYDFIVVESEEFVAVPTLGQIIPGYLLVIPRQHVLSMLQLGAEMRSKLETFVSYVASLQEKYWDRPVIFEHGTCHEMPAGACIAHAHWHLVPGDWNLLPKGIEYDEFGSFNKFAEKIGTSNPYLLFSKQAREGYYWLHGSNIPGQYFRRQLARAIGKPKEWDYLAYPFYENIRETIQKVGTKTINLS